MNRFQRILIHVVSYPLRAAITVFSSVGLFPTFTRAMKTARYFGSGSRAYESGDFESAFRLLKFIADIEPESIPEEATLCYARYYLGLMYYHGQGVQKNELLGEHYFEKAALLGNPEAIEYLKSIGKETKPN